ncbi:MAG: hypothetical protein WC683_04135 [bacterium]
MKRSESGGYTSGELGGAHRCFGCGEMVPDPMWYRGGWYDEVCLDARVKKDRERERRALVRDAARASELFGDDACEAFATSARARR